MNKFKGLKRGLRRRGKVEEAIICLCREEGILLEEVEYFINFYV